MLTEMTDAPFGGGSERRTWAAEPGPKKRKARAGKTGLKKAENPRRKVGPEKAESPRRKVGPEKTHPRRETPAGEFGERGVFCVAIKSIFRSVHVKDHGRAERLVRALENAEGKASATAAKGRTFSDADKAEIRKMFGKKA